MDDAAEASEKVVAHREAVEPLWTRPLFEHLEETLSFSAGAGPSVIGESRCGYLPIEARSRLPDDARLMALEPSRPLLDAARQRADEEGSGDIFFVSERVDAISYADGVFGSAICLNGMTTVRQTANGLGELARVLAEGGQLTVAVPLVSSFEAFYDLLDEALRAEGREELVDRIPELKETLLTPERLAGLARQHDLVDLEMQVVDWTLEFDRGKDFLESPLLEETFLPHWIGIVPSAARQQVLQTIADAIDTYWSKRVFSTGVEAGVVRATVQNEE